MAETFDPKPYLNEVKDILALIRKNTEKKRASVHTVYKNKAGIRVPSVTTFLGILEKPELHSWFWEQGLAGLDCWATRDAAGDTGTLAHYQIECYMAGEEPDLSEYSPDEIATAAVPMQKFHDWFSKHKFEPILVEPPLVSEVYQFGGKPDWYGKLDGVLTLLDWKTGKGIYQEYYSQVAAYKAQLEEDKGLICVKGKWTTHKPFPVEQVILLRFGKSEDEGYEEQKAGVLDKYFEIFLACQQIYNLRKEIRRENKFYE